MGVVNDAEQGQPIHLPVFAGLIRLSCHVACLMW